MRVFAFASDLPSLWASVQERCRQRRWQAVWLLAFAVLPQLPWLGNYYFIDDGLSLWLARQTCEQGWERVWAPGFNGHLRPLPVASWSLVYFLCGPTSPAPFHAFSLLLHVANVGLAWLVLRRLVTEEQQHFAWAGSALFAVHWFGTEAVTYLSALGVLWSMLGGLVGCLGVLRGHAGRPWSGAGLLLGGFLLALAGGEYAVATLPLLAICIAAPFAWRRRDYWTWIAAAMVLGLFGLYITLEVRFANHGRLGTDYVFGGHVLSQLKDGIAQLTFPSGWIGMDVCFALLALALAVALCIPHLRRFLLHSSARWLLLMGVGALLPFAPSKAGHYGRFLYIAAPFFSCWLLLLLAEGATIWQRLNAYRRAALETAFIVLLTANVVHAEKRAFAERKTGQRVGQVVAMCAQNIRADPQRELHVWMRESSHSVDCAMLALDLIGPAQIHAGPPPSLCPPNQHWLMIDNSGADCSPHAWWQEAVPMPAHHEARKGASYREGDGQ